MADMFWLPDSELNESKRKNSRFSDDYEPSKEHGVNIYDGMQKAILDSNQYRNKMDIDAPPLLRLKMRGRVESNNSAASNGMNVEYSYPDGFDLVSVSDVSLKNICMKAKDYRDTFDDKRKNKTLFNRMSDISANTLPLKKMSREILNIIEDGNPIECQVSMVIGDVGQDLSNYSKAILNMLEGEDNVEIISIGTFQDMMFIDVRCDKDTLREVAISPAVISVDAITDVSMDYVDDKNSFSQLFELDDVDLSELGKVCILDTGICFPESLRSVVIGHTVAEGIIPGNEPHGTMVASKVVFGNIHVGRKLRPRCLVHDHCIMEGNRIDPVILAERIRKAVELLNDKFKVFVLSVNKTRPNESSSPDPLSIVIDEVCMKYGVRMITSVGNHNLGGGMTIDDILSDSDSDVRPPADSILSIAVGAVNGHSSDDCTTKRDEPTTYTCKGPGINKIWKPDIVTRSARLNRNNQVVEDEYSKVIGPHGILFEGGTSFSAPFAAGRLEEIRKHIGDDGVILSECLLIATAELPVWSSPLSYVNKHNVIGYGILPDEIGTEGSKVILLHRGKIKVGDELTVRIPIPMDIKVPRNRNDRPRVTITCVSDIRVDHRKGVEAARANIAIHSEDGSQDVGGGMELWSPIHQRIMYLRQDEVDDWAIRLVASGKKEMKDEYVAFALCVTISDPNGYDLSSFIRARAKYPIFTTISDIIKIENVSVRNVTHV